MKQQQYTIGNPVDAWWNDVRQELDFCIGLLGHFPPAPDSETANEFIPAVRRIYELVKDSAYPPQARKIREFLLESLQHLIESLKEQAAHGLLAPEFSHNMAYHKFLMVCYYLLQRGIYEPEPSSYNNRVIS